MSWSPELNSGGLCFTSVTHHQRATSSGPTCEATAGHHRRNASGTITGTGFLARRSAMCFSNLPQAVEVLPEIRCDTNRNVVWIDGKTYSLRDAQEMAKKITLAVAWQESQSRPPAHNRDGCGNGSGNECCPTDGD